MILLSNNHLIKYSNKQLRVSHKLNTEHHDGHRECIFRNVKKHLFIRSSSVLAKNAAGYALTIP